MGTMIPLGSVFGWIFAVLGLIIQTLLFAVLLYEGGFGDDNPMGTWAVYIVGFVALVLGVVLITIYWGGA